MPNQSQPLFKSRKGKLLASINPASGDVFKVQKYTAYVRMVETYALRKFDNGTTVRELNKWGRAILNFIFRLIQDDNDPGSYCPSLFDHTTEELIEMNDKYMTKDDIMMAEWARKLGVEYQR